MTSLSDKEEAKTSSITMADSSSDSCSDKSCVLLDIWDISRSRMGDKELAALERVCSEELFLGQTNVTTFGLTKFIEELLNGYRTLPLCTLFVSPARCNLTAVALSLKAKFNSNSNEYEIHSKVASVYLLVTRGPPENFDPVELIIRTV